MWTSTDLDYEATLHNFQQLFNLNPRAKKLVKHWERLIFLSATDTGSKWGLLVRNDAMVEVRKMASAAEDSDGVVHLEADEAVLKDIFSGIYNPATALMDGALAVFSPERDKVKLEALAMVIWRLG
jgi:putative sterol carrier protein